VETKLYRISLFFIIFCSFFAYSDDIYTNYVQVFGEGPVGQQILGFETKTYTKDEAVGIAKTEVLEFLSGMVFGYNFTYKVENPLNKSQGYFDLKNIVIIKEDRNLTLTQLEESQISIRIQALYRLNENQKSYIRGFGSSIAKNSFGTSSDTWVASWDKRFEVYKDALRNAVLNGAKKNIKSRPLFIKGKILLAESPKFRVLSGEWNATVKINLIITDIKYADVY